LRVAWARGTAAPAGGGSEWGEAGEGRGGGGLAARLDGMGGSALLCFAVLCFASCQAGRWARPRMYLGVRHFLSTRAPWLVVGSAAWLLQTAERRRDAICRVVGASARAAAVLLLRD
jgi:hypothetical protein